MDYAPSLKNTRMNDVKTAIDAGLAAGKIEIYTSGFATLLVSITLAYPASSVAGAILSFLGLPKSGTAIDDGIAAVAKIKDSAGNLVVDNLTVGLSETDITIDNTNIATGQTVNLNSGSIIHG